MTLAGQTVEALLAAVAAKQPTPGGGGVAAVTTGLAAALAEMVIRYRVGKPEAAEHAPVHERALERLGALRTEALMLADRDAAAFERLSALWKLQRDDPKRVAAWDDAVAGAIDAPRAVMAAALETLEILDRVRDTVGRNLRSDLAIAALLARAGAEAAACNVRINLPQVGDDAESARLERATASDLEQAAALQAAVAATCGDG